MTDNGQNPNEFNDEDLAQMLAQPIHFDDAEAFETRVSKALSQRLFWRKSLIGLAGLVGGVYALGQFVSVPLGNVAPKATSEQMLKVSMGTEETFSRGLKLFDDLSHRLAATLELAGGYIDIMHQPAFFWGSFSICATLLALYFAQSQEEVL